MSWEKDTARRFLPTLHHPQLTWLSTSVEYIIKLHTLGRTSMAHRLRPAEVQYSPCASRWTYADPEDFANHHYTYIAYQHEHGPSWFGARVEDNADACHLHTFETESHVLEFVTPDP